METIGAGVPLGCVLEPLLHLLHTCELPSSNDITIVIFADETTIMTVGYNLTDVFHKLQQATHTIYCWANHWITGLIKINLI